MRRRLLWIIAAATLLAVVAAFWSLRARPVRTAGGGDLGTLPRGVSRDRLNLVVVTLDTTRADRIGAYGARNVETPAIDRLAGEGVLFEQAVSVAPLTLPAHSSIFTGKFPPEHGVRDNGGFFLGPEQTTLAELLKARGYRTGGFVAAYVLAAKWGINQGFDTYFDDFDLSQTRALSLSAIQRPANEVLDKALPWIEQSGDSPFFAWIHLYDPHSPYRPPEPFASRYEAHPYNGEIAFVDTQIGRLIAMLRSRNLYDRTIVVVMGDHGESLGEHGEGSHGFFVYNSVTRVPFVIRTPFSLTAHRLVTAPVRSVDVLPTVLDLLAAPPLTGISGVSLVPLMTGEKADLELDAYSEAMYPLHHYGWSDLRALRAGRYKVIDAPRPELYDLDRDPNETTNLFGDRKTLGDRMIARLRTIESGFTKATPAMPASDIDPEARERLAALGYVGTFVATASDPRAGRADPKDKIELFNKLNTATDLSKERDGNGEAAFARAIALLTEVITNDNQVIDAWFMRGTKYLAHGDLEKAVDDFKQALTLKPDYDLAVSNLAQAYRRMGNDDAALSGFERYLALDPKDPFVQYEMGEIWLDRGDLPRAEALFRRTLDVDPSVVAAKNALGVIALQRGDPLAAEQLIREALAAKPTLRLAHFNLALVAEQRGDLRTAEREYLEEIAQHPENFKSAFNLSRLYEQLGDRQGQIDALKQSIVSNPRFAEGHLFLAKAYLASESNLDDAVRLARKGLQLAPTSEFAPLGHYVLADVYNRQGRTREGAAELARGRALEGRMSRKSRSERGTSDR